MNCLQERRKDLTDHRDDSTFSFDPSKINVKQLDKHKRRRVDSRKGVLLASYSRKKTRRRKRPRPTGSISGENGQSQGGQQGPSRSATPSPRHSGSGPCPPASTTTSPPPDTRPQSLMLSPPSAAKVLAVPEQQQQPPPQPQQQLLQPPTAASTEQHASDTLHPSNALGMSLLLLLLLLLIGNSN